MKRLMTMNGHTPWSRIKYALGSSFETRKRSFDPAKQQYVLQCMGLSAAALTSAMVRKLRRHGFEAQNGRMIVYGRVLLSFRIEGETDMYE